MEVDEALEQSREELEEKRRESERRKKELEEKRRREAQEAQRQGLVGAVNYRVAVESEWDNPPANISNKHANLLRKAKVPIADVVNMTDEMRGELCRKIVLHWKLGLCSYKQALLLAKKGWPRMVLENMTFGAASHEIDLIARSGWTKRYQG